MENTALTITVKEAAKRLGFGLIATYKLIHAGELRAVKVGKRPLIRVPVSALLEFLDEGKE